MSGEGSARAVETKATEECRQTDRPAEGAAKPANSDERLSLRTRSHAWCSRRSSASSTGSAAARARARAEAAKTRLVYAEEEMNLKLEKARLEASMEVLKHKKEAAAAIAEAVVLEAAADAGESHSNESHSCELNTDPDHLVASQRTEQYVIDQLRERGPELQLGGNGDMATRSAPPPSPPHLQADTKPFVPRQNNPAPPNLSSQQPCKDVDGGAHDPATRYCREACAPHVRIKNEHAVPVHQFTPGLYDGHPSRYPMPPNCNSDSSHMNDFVKYLARRELVAT